MTRKVYIKATCKCGSDRVYINGRGPIPWLHAAAKFWTLWPGSIRCGACGRVEP